MLKIFYHLLLLYLMFYVITCKSLELETDSMIDQDLMGNNTFCKWTKDYLECSNFTSLDDLNLSEDNNLSSYTFSQLKLSPLNKIIFDTGTLVFRFLKLTANCEIHFENFLGFEIFGNPFFKSGEEIPSLIFSKSNFDFYIEGTKINRTMCDETNRNEIYATLFDNAFSVQLMDDMTYSLDFCPAVLKEAKITTVDIANIGDRNDPFKGFTVIDLNTTLPDAELDCKIQNFIVRDSSVRLDTDLLNPDVLLKTENILVKNTVLFKIEEDLFENKFLNLGYLQLELKNMFEFTDNKYANNSWMKYLNKERFVTSGKQFELELKDPTFLSTFEENSFCLFKDFPHENQVFPVIKLFFHLIFVGVVFISKYKLLE